MRLAAVGVLVLDLAIPIPAAAAAFSGWVLSVEGRPLAGAEVRLYAPESGTSRAERLMLGQARPPLGSTKTAADGTFRIDVGPDVAQLEARVEGYGPRTLTALAGEPLTLELKPASLLRGAVRGQGRPVGGATLVWTGPEDDGGGPSEHIVRSDADGSYVVPDPATWAQGLTIHHPDFAVLSVSPRYFVGSLPLRHELKAGKPLVGKVTAPRGAAVGGVSLWVDGWPAGKTNPDGTFLIPNAPAGAGVLLAKMGALVGSAVIAASPITLDLRKGRTITGTVRDARTRGPIAGAALTLVEENGSSQTVVSDQAGRYEFRPLAPGRYMVTATRKGYVAEFGEEHGDPLVDLRRAGAGTRDFALRKKAVLTGLVTDETGAPIEGARVALLAKGTPTLYARADAFGGEARSSRDGAFSLPHDQEDSTGAGSPFGPILALKEGYAATRIETLEAGQPLLITLVRGLALEGRVTAEDGLPLADVSVTIAEDASVASASEPVHASLRTFVGESWAKTDPDGRFSARVRPGPHDVSFRKPGYQAAIIVGHDPRDEPLETVLSPALGLRGSVVSAEGAGIPGVTLVVRQGSTLANAVTGDDGYFSVEQLSPGAYELFAMKEGTPIGATREGEIPSPDIRIEIPALGQLSGRVVDAKSGAPLASYEIVATPDASDQWWGETAFQSVSEASGQFHLKDVPVGEVTVNVRAEGYLEKRSPAVVSADAGGTPPVEIGLESGVPVHGRVTTSAGQPLENARVTAEAGGDSVGGVETDEGGNYRFAGLRPGTVTLQFAHHGYVSVRKSFDTADTTKMDASLSKGLSLKGVVLRDGVGVARAFVSASSSGVDSLDASAMSGEGGAFTLEGLTGGSYTVTASAADQGQARVENVEAKGAGILKLALESKPTTVLTGTVTGLPSGDSSLVTRVVANGEDGTGGHAPVDARGAFRMEKAPVGRVRVQAFARSLAGESRTSRALDLTLAVGSESQTVLEFRSDIVVTGRITREGAPATGGFVTFHAADGSGGGASAKVGGNGDYEVVGLEPGPYEVSVAGQGFSYSTEYFVRESAEFDIDATGAAVRGQTMDAASGSPLVGVEVTFWRDSETKSSGSEKTNARGVFTARGLREGHYRVLTSKKGYGQQVRELDLSPGAVADLVLELQLSEGLTLTVVDARSGRALDATVVVRDLAKRVVANQHSGVGAEGSLNIPLAAGRYLLSTSATGYGTATIPVAAPGQGLRVPLTPGGTLVVDSERDLRGRIRLVKPDGEEYVRCWCNGIAEITLSGRHTKVEHVTPGTYSIQFLDHAGVAKAGPTVAIEEGQVATVNVE